MSAFYSILYASIRKATQEKLSLGLLLYKGSQVYFKFSTKKLAALKVFLPKQDYQLIHQSINAVNNSILTHSEVVYVDSQEVYLIDHAAFSIDYINYLSRYKNNLITYSEPKAITIEVTPENMLKLYESMIGLDVNPAHMAPKLSPVDQLSLQFNGRIEEHFNVNYTLTSERIPNLLVPVKVDLLGRNGMDVLVRAIDTSANFEKIANEVSTFYVLKDAYRKNKMPVKDFIIAEEPSHKLKKQHDIWRQIKDSGNFTYIDLSEADKLREYAEENNVKPAIPNIDDQPF